MNKRIKTLCKQAMSTAGLLSLHPLAIAGRYSQP